MKLEANFDQGRQAMLNMSIPPSDHDESIA